MGTGLIVERDPSFPPLESQIFYLREQVSLGKIGAMLIIYPCDVMSGSFLKRT